MKESPYLLQQCPQWLISPREKISRRRVSGRYIQVPPAASVRGLDVGMDVNALVEIEEAVLSPAEGVDDVVGVLGAEAGEDDAGRVGLAVAVGVGEVEDLGGVGDVGAAVAGE